MYSSNGFNLAWLWIVNRKYIISRKRKAAMVEEIGSPSGELVYKTYLFGSGHGFLGLCWLAQAVSLDHSNQAGPCLYWRDPNLFIPAPTDSRC